MARNTDGKISFTISLDNDQLRRDALQSQKILQGIGSSAQVEGARIDTTFRNIARSAGLVFGAQQAVQFARSIVQVRGEMQGLGLAFETMLGSKAKADKMMADVIDFAQKTPFTVTDVASNVKQLIAMGAAGDDVMKTFKTLGDVAAGVNVPISRIAINYGQVAALGKLQSREIRDFAMAGIPIVGELAKMYGVAEDEIMGMVEAGKIGFPDVQKAFAAMAGEGGKFNNMMEKLNSTVSGQMSRLQDQIEQMFNKIGAANEGVIYGAIDGAATLVEHYKEILAVITALVKAYGMYWTATKLVETVGVANQSVRYTAEIQALEALVVAKEADKNADIQKLVLDKKLTVSQAEKIVALRAELAVQLQVAQAEAFAARAAVKNAKDAIIADGYRLSALKAKVSALHEQYAAELAAGNTTKANTILERANAEAKKFRAAQASFTTNREQLSTLQTNAQNKTLAANTLQQNINNASKTAGAVATNIFTAAQRAAAMAVKSLTTAFKANPIGWIATAVMLAVSAFQMFKKATDESTASIGQLEQATKDMDASIESETAVLDLMFRRLEKATEGTDEYAAAKKAIFDKYGSYLSSMTEEQRSLLTTTELYNTLAEAIKNAATARAQEQFITDAATAKSNRQSEALKSLDAYLKGELGNGAKADELFLQLRNILERSIKGGVDGNQAFFDFYDLLEEIGAYDKKRQGELSKIFQDYQYANIDYKKAVKDAEKYFVTDGTVSVATGFDAAKASIEELTKELPNAKAKLEALIKAGDDQEAINKQQLLVDTINAQIQARIKAGQTSKAYWEAEKTRITGELDGLKEIDRQGEKGAKLRAELASVDQRLQTWNTKVTAETEKQAKDLADTQRKYEDEVSQARVDAMNDGLEKVLAQNELNFEREKAQIENQYSKLSDVERQFLIDAAKTRRDVADKAARIAEVERQKQESDQLLQDYGSYLEKRSALTDEWEKKIANTPLQYQDTARKKMSEALTSMDFEQFQNDLDFSYVFSNLERVSDEALSDLITRLKEFRSDATKAFNPDDLEEYINALEKLQDESHRRSEGWIGELNVIPDSIKKRLRLQKELNEAERDYNEAIERKNKIETELNAATEKYKNLVAELTGEQVDLTTATDEYIESLIRKKGLESGQSEQQIDDSVKQFRDAGSMIQNIGSMFSNASQNAGNAADMFGKAGGAMQSFAGGASGAIGMVDMIVKAVHQTFQAIQQITDSINELYEAIGKDTSIDTGIGKWSEFMNMASEFDSYTFSSWNKLKEGDLMGATADAISSWLSIAENIAKWNDKKHQKAIEDYQKSVDALDRAYRKLNWDIEDNQDVIDKSYGKDKQSAIDEETKIIEMQIKNLEDQNALIKKQIQEEKDKKNTDDEALQDYYDTIEQNERDIELSRRQAEENTKERRIDAIYGQDIQQAISDFASAYADAWSQGIPSKDGIKDAVMDMIKEAVKQIIMSAPELQNALKYLREILIPSILADNVVSDEELKQLENWSNGVAGNLDAKYSGLMNIFKDFEEATTRTSASQGFAQASQDSIDKIDGILTNIQNHTYGIFELMKSSVPVADSLSGYFANIEAPVINIAEMMRTNQQIQQANTDNILGRLTNIDINTRELYAMRKDLHSALGKMDDMIDGIDRFTR